MCFLFVYYLRRGLYLDSVSHTYLDLFGVSSRLFLVFAECKCNAWKPTDGIYTLRRLSGGCHPVHSCKATIGKIVPLNGAADADELRHLEERLEEISRIGKVKAQRGGHLIPSAAEPAPGNSAGTGSTAKDKLCTLRQRIQLKELAFQQHSSQEARGCQGVPEHSGNSQLPLML